jgi:hypothetical protein
MTHDELKKQWSKKHRTVFSQMNKILKEHGIPGSVVGLTMKPTRAIAVSAEAAEDDCCGGCKEPPCAPDERIEICTCPDGSGGFKVHKCCVPA